MLVDLGTAPVEFLNIRMIVRLREHARDHPTLLGHAHALGGASRLDVFLLDVALVRGGHVGVSLEPRSFTPTPDIILAVSGMCPPHAQTKSRRRISAVAAVASAPG